MKTQYNTIQHNTIQYNTMQYNTTQYNAIQYNATQYNTMQYYTIQYNTIQYNTIQYDTTKHNPTQHNTIQHNTTQHLTFARQVSHDKESSSSRWKCNPPSAPSNKHFNSPTLLQHVTFDIDAGLGLCADFLPNSFSRWHTRTYDCSTISSMTNITNSEKSTPPFLFNKIDEKKFIK